MTNEIIPASEKTKKKVRKWMRKRGWDELDLGARVDEMTEEEAKKAIERMKNL